MLFYCPNCRKEVEVEPAGTVTTKSGRVAYKANCPTCGQDMAEFVPPQGEATIPTTTSNTPAEVTAKVTVGTNQTVSTTATPVRPSENTKTTTPQPPKAITDTTTPANSTPAQSNTPVLPPILTEDIPSTTPTLDPTNADQTVSEYISGPTDTALTPADESNVNGDGENEDVAQKALDIAAQEVKTTPTTTLTDTKIGNGLEQETSIQKGLTDGNN